MQTPSFVIRNLFYIIKCCKVFVNSMFVFRQRQRAENPPRRLRIFVKDAHLQNFLSFLKKTLDFPGGGRYNKTRSPARTPKEYAPVAQLDRVSDYESEGRGFESLPAHQIPQIQTLLLWSFSFVARLEFASPGVPAGRFAVKCKAGNKQSPRRYASAHLRGLFVKSRLLSQRRQFFPPAV